MQCLRCGGNLPAGGPCPACGWMGEQLGQQGPVTGRADAPTPLAFPDACETPAAPAPEVPIPYPRTDMASDHADMPVKVEGDMVCKPDSDFTPSEGDEPGTGGPGRAIGGLPGGANPLLVAGIVIVLVVVVATIYLLAGDGNGGPNGHDGPGPDGGLLIDPLETSVVNVWEPTPGFHLSVVISNNANASKSMDGHDLLVTILLGTEEVGQATMAVSGDLAPGHDRGVLIDVGVDLTSGQTYEVNVLLRKDGGTTTVDAYHTEVTIPQS